MDVLIAYHGMARGSPCVVPSWDKISSPQVNNLEGLLYMLMIYMDISGQEIWMLLASINRILSVPPSSKIWAMACMVALAPALYPAQTCRGPDASLIPSFWVDMVLPIIRLKTSPTPTRSNSWVLNQWNKPSGRVAFQPQRTVLA